MKIPTVAELLNRESNNSLVQMFRYAIAGLVAFACDYSTLYVLKSHIGLHYLIAVTIAFICGLIVSYLLSIKWVFSRRTMNNRKKEFIIFTIISVVGLLLTLGIMRLCTGTLGIHYLISKIISTATVFFWNFIAKKIILFK